MTTVGLLLAAGHSRRFGQGNKLLAAYQGCPLITHAADSLRHAGCDHLVAVARDPDVIALLDGFEIVRLDEAKPDGSGQDQSASLRAGVQACAGFDKILVALGDMPLVTAGHLRAVMSLCTAKMASASFDGTRSPPACFPASMAPDLLAMEGDRGAGPLIKNLPHKALVEAPGQLLKDIDTEHDLR